MNSDKPVPYGDYMKEISHVVYQTCETLDFPVPYILWTRTLSIVELKQITLYRVVESKRFPIYTYVSVNGGMTDNPR